MNMQINRSVLFAAGAILASLDEIKDRLRKQFEFDEFEPIWKDALALAVSKTKIREKHNEPN